MLTQAVVPCYNRFCQIGRSEKTRYIKWETF
nr:MAG TPA_asm: hypothetical protein [Caudoviricetes sp.]